MKKFFLLVAMIVMVSLSNHVKAQVWSEVGGTNSLGANSFVQSVCSDANGNIYAAGDFTNAHGNYYVAKYNGTSWNELGGVNSLAANGRIWSICSDANGNIYAGGWFKNGSGNYYVAKYNGNSWSELGGVNSLAANGIIETICIDVFGNIYAAGGFWNSHFTNTYVAKYDGNSWSELGSSSPLAANDLISSICTDAAGNLYAAGDFTNSSGNRYVAKYNGTSWSELGGLNGLAADGFIADIICHAGIIYAVGEFNNSTNPLLTTSSHYYVAEYNGTSWSELGGLNALSANNFINSVNADLIGNIYAAGDFTNGIAWFNGQQYVFTGHQYVAKWDGTSWSELGGLDALHANNSIQSICINSSGNIFVGGSFKNSSNKNYVAQFGQCPIAYSNINDTINSVNSYVFYGDTLKASGTYRDTLHYALGCDTVVVLTLTTASGMNNIASSNKINIYPNPSNHSTVISLQYAVNHATIQLINLLGETVFTKTNQSGKQFNLDLSNQAAGIYFIVVKQAAEVWRGKVVKE